MRATLTAVAVAASLLVGVVATTTVATAQDEADPAVPEPAESAPYVVGDDVLIDRLVGLEQQLPPLPPTDVVLGEDTTWGQLQGDFFAAATDLSLLADDARSLFADADDADGAAAAAVAAVARGYLELAEGFDYLAAYEEFDLSRPLDTFDGDGVATGADTATGLATTGLAMVDTARLRSLAGYSVLRDAAAADDAAKELFAAAFDDTEYFLDVTRPRIHELLSMPSVGLLVSVQRFEAQPDEGHATAAEYVCLERADVPDPDADVDPAAQLLDLLDAGVELSESIDCPALPNGNQVVTSAADPDA